MSNPVRSANQHLFSMVPRIDIPRSVFDRSCNYKTCFNSGYLIPVFVDEALPGDTFQMKSTFLCRLNTPIFPFLDNLYLDVHFFSVPVRQVWSNFRKFMGEQANPGDSTAYVCPTATSPAGGYAVGSLQDYMGIPTAGQITGANTVEHNNLFFRAYNHIWNEWFRDENLQNSVVVDLDDGPDNPADYVLLKRGKRHDYITSALPWTQKGTAVSLPLGTSAPVRGLIAGTGANTVAIAGGSYVGTAPAGAASMHPLSSMSVASSSAIGTAFGTAFSDANALLDVDLSSATAATINQLREAVQLQAMMERDARGGTRYVEIIKAHFGVSMLDMSYRPEYLGGGSMPINISAVPKTSSTDGTSPQGNLAAYGTAVGQPPGFIKSFTEHCIIIGMVSVRADLTYQQGLPRMFKRSTKYDFYWPGLAQIGEQAITQDEIYCLGTAADDTVFGYQERYAEYRYKQSMVTGILRSTAASSLDPWHAAQEFTGAPTLNSTFIEETPPISRLVAVPSQPEFFFDSHFSLRCTRPMPLYGLPSTLGRF